MSFRLFTLGARAVALGFVALTVVCSPGSSPQVGTQTNWLRACQSDAQCGVNLPCNCGTCAPTCDSLAGDCAALAGAVCIPTLDDGLIALCGGDRPATALCLPTCDGGCPNGSQCVAGVCSPARVLTDTVTLNTTTRYQTLVGIGAGVGFISRELVRHPRKSALFEAMFGSSGFSVLRLSNDFVRPGEGDFSATREIVDAASSRLGSALTLFMTSASPPSALKANGSRRCEGNPDTCTLVKLADGRFDYVGFAQYWRDALDAYATAGITPDYISIQNNPNWVPPTGTSLDACRFLPTEGTASVTTAQGTSNVDYPGYAEALTAVSARLMGLASRPQLVGPETTGVVDVASYVERLDLAQLGAVAHHLYGEDAADRPLFEGLRDLGATARKPIFQTEMEADALSSAALLHAALAVEGASVYVHNGFVSSSSSIQPDPMALINLTEQDFKFGDAYYVFRHYSAGLRKGSVRVDARANHDDLLTSAWLSPDGAELTVILTNLGLSERVVAVEGAAAFAASSEVRRTVLQGTERFASLGPLPAKQTVTLPGQALATVVLRR